MALPILDVQPQSIRRLIPPPMTPFLTLDFPDMTAVTGTNRIVVSPYRGQAATAQNSFESVNSGYE